MSDRVLPGDQIGRLLAWVSGLLCLMAWPVVASAQVLPTADRLADQVFLQVELGAHAGAVRRLAIDVSRNLVVTGSDDKTARSWALDSGQLERIFRPPLGHGEVGRVYGVALNPVQPWLAVAGTSGSNATSGDGHSIYIFDVLSGSMLRKFDARAGDIKRLLWSSDGSLLFAGYAGAHGLRVFDVNGTQTFADVFEGGVYAMAVTQGNLAAAGLDGTLRIYKLKGRSEQSAISLVSETKLSRNPASVAFSPDGQSLAIGYFEPGRSPDVLNLDSRSVTALPALPGLGGERLMTVAWSPRDGRIVAGGSFGFKQRKIQVVYFDVPRRQVSAVEVGAKDSITDLVALPDGRVVFAAIDGSWGLVSSDLRSTVHSSQIPDLTGASNLLISENGRQISWTLDGGSGRILFDLEKRSLAANAGENLSATRTRRGLFDAATNWQDETLPRVNGKRIDLQRDEVSRAVALLATGDAVLGTSRALYRIDVTGNVLWRISTQTEVRAVNVSADGKLIVTAMLNGTIVIRRFEDGQELLSIFALRDGRWVLWTPSGYYDASVGADRLIGWAVSKGPQQAMDFYSLNRFRERFNRPDVIDGVLKSLDEARALEALGAQQTASRDQAIEDAKARQREAQMAARAAAEAAESMQQAALQEAQARLRAEQAAREAGAKAELARQSEAQRVAAQQTAERDAAERQAAARLAEARAAAEREAANQKAAEEAARTSARLAAEQEAAKRLAAARELAAAQAAAEAAAREAAVLERKALAIIKALEVPPALSASDAKRIKLAAPEVTLQFAVSSSGTAANLSLEVRVNGRPAQPIETVLPASLDGSARGFTKLSLGEGESLVEILATNVHGVSEPLSFNIERAQSAAPGVTAGSGDLYVLAIGVSDYVRADYRLGLAAKDAADFANAMKLQEGRQYRRVVVHALTNREATRANIAKEFEWLRQSAGPRDVAMLFMAGHGLNDTMGQYYFLPADGQHERLASTAVPQGTIVSTLSKIRGKTLLFLDTCFAGNSLGALRQAGRQTERMMNDLSSSENGVIVFASSTGKEESEEKTEWGNGAFTKALIEGLGGKADFMRAGRVTYAALNLFVSEEVSRLTQGRQRPVFISPRGIPDFALVRL